MAGNGEVKTSGLSERIQQLLPRVSYKLAVTREDRDQIFRLRHDAYLLEGAITPQAGGLFSDEADVAKNTLVFGVHIDGALMSSIRLSVGSVSIPCIPSGQVFPEILEPEIESGKTIIDPTRFVVERASSRLFPELPYITLRLAWIAMEHFEADILLAAVRPEHASFYQRFWGTRQITPPRLYSPLTKPVCLTISDYAAVRDAILARYPFLHSTRPERDDVFGTVTLDGSMTPARTLPTRAYLG